LPYGITSIGEKAFYDCPALSYINILSTVTSIDDSAFTGSNNVTIYGESGSYAQQYAQDKSIPFVSVTAPKVSVWADTNFTKMSGDNYTIKFKIDQPGRVSITIYDGYNNTIRNIFKEQQYSGAGTYRVEWDCRDNDGKSVKARYYDVHVKITNAHELADEAIKNMRLYYEQSVTGLTLSDQEISITQGDQFQLVATLLPVDISVGVMTWSATDNAVATADQAGKVTAIAPGSTTITVEAGGFTDACVVTVLEKEQPAVAAVSEPEAASESTVPATPIPSAKPKPGGDHEDKAVAGDEGDAQGSFLDVWLWVIIGVVVLGVLAFVFFFVRKRRKAKNITQA